MKNEQILVVKRDLLFKEKWTGFRPSDFSSYLEILKKHREFLPRPKMEYDFSYKQIIPYLIFEYDGKFFVMERRADTTEQRLKSKISMGIGGHIVEEDIKGSDIFDWARREFHEEVDYKDDFKVEPLGLVNDDSDEVGSVHTGFVFLLKGSSGNIQIKSELKSGKLISLEECLKLRDRMETWSMMVLDYLVSL